MNEPIREQPNRMAVAMHWVSQITTGSLMLALPAVCGYWLDSAWNTRPWLLIVGACLGFVAFFTYLLQMAGVVKPRK